MEITEYFDLRNEIIDNSLDEDKVFSEESFLSAVLPDLLEVKLIDSEDIVFSYVKKNLDSSLVKINGYMINETGERLQIFLVNDNATGLNSDENSLKINLKDYYQKQFIKSIRFIKGSIKRHIELHDSDTAGFLVSRLGNSDFIKDIEVIEVFLISPTVTVETRGTTHSTKSMTFEDEEFNVSYMVNREKHSKSILITKKLIDLNFLYDVSVSKGYKYALEVNFNEIFDKKIEVLKAADEENFESYLCVLPAEGLAALYRKFSTRLLEKNVRSFLNFRVEANSEMRKTIRNKPERFIAYNNGLTITATQKSIEEKNDKLYLNTLTDFQIVNGGQTTASIFFSKKDGLDISKINIMAKITIAKNISEEELNDLISKISLFSNTQSKVSKVDLKSRNPQIDKIKSLSVSVVSPQGYKWFFEKARGEYNTMVRLAGGNKNRIEKSYPRKRRVTKTDLGKYYTAWGDKPWMVKKGGERIFRYFIEHISGQSDDKKQLEINRLFFEELISKTIIFRELENIHGARKNAIGQLRSAVVPYSMSVLFFMFGGSDKRVSKFDLSLIWLNQGLEDDLVVFLKKLMILLYKLIKKNATSDDLGENTKKEELWLKIKRSSEVKQFISSEDSAKILKKYTNAGKKTGKYIQVDFSHISDSVDLLSRGKEFYKSIQMSLDKNSFDIDYKPRTFELYMNQMFPFSGVSSEMSIQQVTFFKKLFKQIRENAPKLFDKAHLDYNNTQEEIPVKHTLNTIIELYNKILSENNNIESEFNKHALIAEYKKIKYSGTISMLGKKLAKGEPPLLKDLYLTSRYFKGDKKNYKTRLHDNLEVAAEKEVLYANVSYYKLVGHQDIARTPSISRSAAENFFHLSIDNNESILIDLIFDREEYSIELNKRKTRNEYRFFLNRIRDTVSYDLGDIIKFSKKDKKFCLKVIKKGEENYNSVFDLMNGKLHHIG